jgi:hypothetical protein
MSIKWEWPPSGRDRQDGQTEYRFFMNLLGVGLIADILKLTNERLRYPQTYSPKP